MVMADCRRRILGIPVDDVTIAEVVAQLRDWAAENAGTVHQVVTVNPEFIMAARRDGEFRAVLERSDLATADGIGVILAGRLLHRPLRQRVTGVDLAEALAASGEAGFRLFFFGARPRLPGTAAALL